MYISMIAVDFIIVAIVIGIVVAIVIRIYISVCILTRTLYYVHCTTYSVHCTVYVKGLMDDYVQICKLKLLIE